MGIFKKNNTLTSNKFFYYISINLYLIIFNYNKINILS